MKVEIDVIPNILRVGFLLIFFSSFSQQHPLIKYYDGDLKLTRKQEDSLVQKTLKERESNYLMALAHFQNGAILTRNGKDAEAYTGYITAFDYLQNADTVDHYLFSSILLRKGVILHNYKLYEEAVKNYQDALDASYQFSINHGLNTEYNVALAMMQFDPKNGFEKFLALKNKVNDDVNRLAEILNQIGLFYKRTEQYDDAIATYESGLELGVSGRLKANLLQNISDVYFHQQDYKNQEKYLREVLSTSKGNHFLALMDLGECYLLQDRKEEALEVLIKAEAMYDKQSLKPEHIKVYKWLMQASDDPVPYANRHIEELNNYIESSDKLKDTMKTLAMKNILAAVEAEQQKKEETSLLRILAILGAAASIVILLTWKIWWNRLRRNLGLKITRAMEG